MKVIQFINAIKKKGFNEQQANLLAKYALTDINFSCLCSKDLKIEQMQTLGYGLEKGYPVYLYADPSITYKKMNILNKLCEVATAQNLKEDLLEYVVKWGLKLPDEFAVTLTECVELGYIPDDRTLEYLTKAEEKHLPVKPLVECLKVIYYVPDIYDKIDNDFSLSILLRCVRAGFSVHNIRKVFSCDSPSSAFKKTYEGKWLNKEISPEKLSYF